MTAKQQRERAIVRARRYGLTAAQAVLLRGLDRWFDEYPYGPTRHEMMALTGLGYGTIAVYLPVLAALGYVRINRDRRGRALPRGVILMCTEPLSIIGEVS